MPQISWHVVLTVRPGRLDDFRALNPETVEAAQGERGVLYYERLASDDGQAIHNLRALHGFGGGNGASAQFCKTFGERFGTMVDRTQFAVLANPSGRIARLLTG